MIESEREAMRIFDRECDEAGGVRKGKSDCFLDKLGLNL